MRSLRGFDCMDLALTWLPGLAPKVADDAHDGQGDRWFTPAYVGKSIVEILGDKWIDPCGDPASPVTATAARWLDYRKGFDGLTCPWPDGPAFVNPPYSNASAWIARCAQEAKTRQVVALVPLRPEGKAWHAHVWPCAKVVIPAGRLRFVGADGQTHGSAMIGTAFLCWQVDAHALSFSLARNGLQCVVVGQLSPLPW